MQSKTRVLRLQLTLLKNGDPFTLRGSLRVAGQEPTYPFRGASALVQLLRDLQESTACVSASESHDPPPAADHPDQ